MTPETDAAERMAFAQEQMVPTEFARRLERERDEAREKSERYRIDANAMMMQRDEAREEVRLLKGIHDLIKKDTQ